MIPITSQINSISLTLCRPSPVMSTNAMNMTVGLAWMRQIVVNVKCHAFLAVSPVHIPTDAIVLATVPIDLPRYTEPRPTKSL